MIHAYNDDFDSPERDVTAAVAACAELIREQLCIQFMAMLEDETHPILAFRRVLAPFLRTTIVLQAETGKSRDRYRSYLQKDSSLLVAMVRNLGGHHVLPREIYDSVAQRKLQVMMTVQSTDDGESLELDLQPIPAGSTSDEIEEMVQRRFDEFSNTVDDDDEGDE